jgi:hypothetical protein
VAKRLAPDKARAEMARRNAAAMAAVTPAAIADGHAAQFQLLQSRARSIVLMCSRRAGKTWACCGALLLAALSTSGTSCLYLALTSGQARKVWAKTWKPMLRRFGIRVDPTESDMIARFANGATVQFGGTDDVRHIQSLLGDSMAGGLAVLDEAQSDPGLMEHLIVDILEPMLSETNTLRPRPGRLIVAGTVPEVAAGFFWKTWVENHEVEGSDWECMAWSRFDNPHTHNNRVLLDDYLKRYNLDESDPVVQRNWFGARVFDANVTAYRYVAARSAYSPQPAPWVNDLELPPGKLRAVIPPPGVDTFSVGLDPASRHDRYGIVLWGWGKGSPEVFQIAEWVTPEAAGTIQSQWAAVLEVLRYRYPNIVGWYRDAGSAAETIDLVQRDYKLVVEAVGKGPGSLKGRVDRFADLLGQGRAKVIAGGELERDLTLCRWDQAARERGKWAWASSHHGDVADAATYGLVGYFNAFERKPTPETLDQMHERLFRESFVKPVKYGYEDDPGLVHLLGESGPPS